MKPSSVLSLSISVLGTLFLQSPHKVLTGPSEIPPPAAAVFIVQNRDITTHFHQEANENGAGQNQNRILLNDIVNTDVEIEPDLKVEFECMASHPIQWNYRGPGRPQFSTNVSVGILNNKDVFKASLIISNSNEKDTGMYTCLYTEFPAIHSNYHLFVPGPEIFVANYGKTVYYSGKMHTVTIPCPVTVKNAKVMLRRVGFDNSLRNMDEPLAIFEPKTGFKLNIRDLRDIDGIYICSASFEGRLRLREFTLRNLDRNQTSVTFPNIQQDNINPCRSYSCPSRSVCRVNLNTNQPFCACRSKISSSVVANCTRLCKTSQGCPKSEKCQFSVEKQVKMCMHVCQDHACAENADCHVDEEGGGPKCQCRRGFQGNGNFLCERIPLKPDESSSYCSSTKCGDYARCQNVDGKSQCACNLGTVGVWPVCAPACTTDDDCDLTDKCSSKGVCEHVCNENMCAPKAECKVLQRKPQCLCPPGYTGKATEACYPSHYFFSNRMGMNSNEEGVTDSLEGVEDTTVDPRPNDENENIDKSLKLHLPSS